MPNDASRKSVRVEITAAFLVVLCVIVVSIPAVTAVCPWGQVFTISQTGTTNISDGSSCGVVHSGYLSIFIAPTNPDKIVRFVTFDASSLLVVVNSISPMPMLFPITVTFQHCQFLSTTVTADLLISNVTLEFHNCSFQHVVSTVAAFSYNVMVTASAGAWIRRIVFTNCSVVHECLGPCAGVVVSNASTYGEVNVTQCSFNITANPVKLSLAAQIVEATNYTYDAILVAPPGNRTKSASDVSSLFVVSETVALITRNYITVSTSLQNRTAGGSLLRLPSLPFPAVLSMSRVNVTIAFANPVAAMENGAEGVVVPAMIAVVVAALGSDSVTATIDSVAATMTLTACRRYAGLLYLEGSDDLTAQSFIGTAPTNDVQLTLVNNNVTVNHSTSPYWSMLRPVAASLAFIHFFPFANPLSGLFRSLVISITSNGASHMYTVDGMISNDPLYSVFAVISNTNETATVELSGNNLSQVVAFADNNTLARVTAQLIHLEVSNQSVGSATLSPASGGRLDIAVRNNYLFTSLYAEAAAIVVCGVNDTQALTPFEFTSATGPEDYYSFLPRSRSLCFRRRSSLEISSNFIQLETLPQRVGGNRGWGTDVGAITIVGNGNMPSPYNISQAFLSERASVNVSDNTINWNCQQNSSTTGLLITNGLLLHISSSLDISKNTMLLSVLGNGRVAMVKIQGGLTVPPPGPQQPPTTFSGGSLPPPLVMQGNQGTLVIDGPFSLPPMGSPVARGIWITNGVSISHFVAGDGQSTLFLFADNSVAVRASSLPTIVGSTQWFNYSNPPSAQLGGFVFEGTFWVGPQGVAMLQRNTVGHTGTLFRTFVGWDIEAVALPQRLGPLDVTAANFSGLNFSDNAVRGGVLPIVSALSLGSKGTFVPHWFCGEWIGVRIRSITAVLNASGGVGPMISIEGNTVALNAVPFLTATFVNDLPDGVAHLDTNEYDNCTIGGYSLSMSQSDGVVFVSDDNIIDACKATDISSLILQNCSHVHIAYSSETRWWPSFGRRLNGNIFPYVVSKDRSSTLWAYGYTNTTSSAERMSFTMSVEFDCPLQPQADGFPSPTSGLTVNGIVMGSDGTPSSNNSVVLVNSNTVSLHVTSPYREKAATRIVGMSGSFGRDSVVNTTSNRCQVYSQHAESTALLTQQASTVNAAHESVVVWSGARNESRDIMTAAAAMTQKAQSRGICIESDDAVTLSVVMCEISLRLRFGLSSSGIEWNPIGGSAASIQSNSVNITTIGGFAVGVFTGLTSSLPLQPVLTRSRLELALNTINITASKMIGLAAASFVVSAVGVAFSSFRAVSNSLHVTQSDDGVAVPLNAFDTMYNMFAGLYFKYPSLSGELEVSSNNITILAVLPQAQPAQQTSRGSAYYGIYFGASNITSTATDTLIEANNVQIVFSGQCIEPSSIIGLSFRSVNRHMAATVLMPSPLTFNVLRNTVRLDATNVMSTEYNTHVAGVEFGEVSLVNASSNMLMTAIPKVSIDISQASVEMTSIHCVSAVGLRILDFIGVVVDVRIATLNVTMTGSGHQAIAVHLRGFNTTNTLTSLSGMSLYLQVVGSSSNGGRGEHIRGEGLSLENVASQSAGGVVVSDTSIAVDAPGNTSGNNVQPTIALKLMDTTHKALVAISNVTLRVNGTAVIALMFVGVNSSSSLVLTNVRVTAVPVSTTSSGYSTVEDGRYFAGVVLFQSTFTAVSLLLSTVKVVCNIFACFCIGLSVQEVTTGIRVTYSSSSVEVSSVASMALRNLTDPSHPFNSLKCTEAAMYFDHVAHATIQLASGGNLSSASGSAIVGTRMEHTQLFSPLLGKAETPLLQAVIAALLILQSINISVDLECLRVLASNPSIIQVGRNSDSRGLILTPLSVVAALNSSLLHSIKIVNVSLDVTDVAVASIKKGVNITVVFFDEKSSTYPVAYRGSSVFGINVTAFALKLPTGNAYLRYSFFDFCVDETFDYVAAFGTEGLSLEVSQSSGGSLRELPIGQDTGRSIAINYGAFRRSWTQVTGDCTYINGNIVPTTNNGSLTGGVETYDSSRARCQPSTVAPSAPNVTTTDAPLSGPNATTIMPVTSTAAPNGTLPDTTTPVPSSMAPRTTTAAPNGTLSDTTTPVPSSTAPVTPTAAPNGTLSDTTTAAPNGTLPGTTTAAPSPQSICAITLRVASVTVGNDTNSTDDTIGNNNNGSAVVDVTGRETVLHVAFNASHQPTRTALVGRSNSSAAVTDVRNWQASASLLVVSVGQLRASDLSLDVAVRLRDQETLREPTVTSVVLLNQSVACQPQPILTITLILHPLVVPPPLVSTTVVSSVATAVGSASIVSAVACGGTPIAAVTASKFKGILSMSGCNYDHFAPLDFLTSPSQLSFGEPFGQYYRGAVVGNLLIVGVVGAIVLVAGLFALRSDATPRQGGGYLMRAVMLVHLPSVLYVPFGIVCEGLAVAATATIVHARGAGDWFVGCFGWVCLVMLLLYGWATIRSFPCVLVPRASSKEDEGKYAPSAMSAWIDKYFRSSEKWVIKSAQGNNDPLTASRYKQLHQHLFNDYRVPFYPTLELTLTALFGMLEGVRLDGNNAACFVTSVGVLVLALAICVIIVWKQPAMSMFEKLSVYLLNGVALLAAILLVLGNLMDNSSILDATDLAAMCGLALNMLKLIGTILGVLEWALRHNQLSIEGLRALYRKRLLTVSDVQRTQEVTQLTVATEVTTNVSRRSSPSLAPLAHAPAPEMPTGRTSPVSPAPLPHSSLPSQSSEPNPPTIQREGIFRQHALFDEIARSLKVKNVESYYDEEASRKKEVKEQQSSVIEQEDLFDMLSRQQRQRDKMAGGVASTITSLPLAAVDRPCSTLALPINLEQEDTDENDDDFL